MSGEKMITLRQLNKDDAFNFRHIRLLGLRESPTAFGASFAQEENMSVGDFAQRLDGGPDRWVIGAFDEDQLVGVVGFYREGSDKTRHKGGIWGMFVSPQSRRKGVGRALFEDALRRIDETPGLRSVRLSVVTSNKSALRLYEKLGFIRFGEEHEALYVDGAFHSEYHMVRKTKNEPDQTTQPTPDSGHRG
jgi:ribosomal protein S18 acetylase RimI-like enzyme